MGLYDLLKDTRPARRENVRRVAVGFVTLPVTAQSATRILALPALLQAVIYALAGGDDVEIDTALDNAVV